MNQSARYPRSFPYPIRIHCDIQHSMHHHLIDPTKTSKTVLLLEHIRTWTSPISGGYVKYVATSCIVADVDCKSHLKSPSFRMFPVTWD